jgi:hypothetical protein
LARPKYKKRPEKTINPRPQPERYLVGNKNVPDVKQVGVLETKCLDRTSKIRDKSDVSSRSEMPKQAGVELRPSANLRKEVVLEVFEGVVDKIVDDIGYVTLRSGDGDVFYGQYGVSELTKHGIGARSRFSVKTVENDGRIRIRIRSLPDRRISSERLQELNTKIDKVLANYGDGDDY